MDKTVAVKVSSQYTHPKYKKTVRKTKTYLVHDQNNQAKLRLEINLTYPYVLRCKSPTWGQYAQYRLDMSAIFSRLAISIPDVNIPDMLDLFDREIAQRYASIMSLVFTQDYKLADLCIKAVIEFFRPEVIQKTVFDNNKRYLIFSLLK